ATAPGTVTVSHPRSGIDENPRKRLGVHAAGDRPDELSPWSFAPSQTMANASLPKPLPVGSTTVKAIAAAMAASIALPPLCSILSPACTARGCEAATTFWPMTGDREDGYGS